MPATYKEKEAKSRALNMYKMTDTLTFSLHTTPFQTTEAPLTPLEMHHRAGYSGCILFP